MVFIFRFPGESVKERHLLGVIGEGRLGNSNETFSWPLVKLLVVRETETARWVQGAIDNSRGFQLARAPLQWGQSGRSHRRTRRTATPTTQYFDMHTSTNRMLDNTEGFNRHAWRREECFASPFGVEDVDDSHRFDSDILSNNPASFLKDEGRPLSHQPLASSRNTPSRTRLLLCACRDDVAEFRLVNPALFARVALTTSLIHAGVAVVWKMAQLCLTLWVMWNFPSSRLQSLTWKCTSRRLG